MKHDPVAGADCTWHPRSKTSLQPNRPRNNRRWQQHRTVKNLLITWSRSLPWRTVSEAVKHFFDGTSYTFHRPLIRICEQRLLVASRSRIGQIRLRPVSGTQGHFAHFRIGGRRVGKRRRRDSPKGSAAFRDREYRAPPRSRTLGCGRRPWLLGHLIHFGQPTAGAHHLLREPRVIEGPRDSASFGSRVSAPHGRLWRHSTKRGEGRLARGVSVDRRLGAEAGERPLDHHAICRQLALRIGARLVRRAAFHHQVHVRQLIRVSPLQRLHFEFVPHRQVHHRPLPAELGPVPPRVEQVDLHRDLVRHLGVRRARDHHPFAGQCHRRQLEQPTPCGRRRLCRLAHPLLQVEPVLARHAAPRIVQHRLQLVQALSQALVLERLPLQLGAAAVEVSE
mmetsp:Transcript_31992/g.79671  ORF Transcript_31992/g.79671 Transcript_31992/m.79671 type:complete len:393 (+) Transcript_31992:180-1358(+)